MIRSLVALFAALVGLATLATAQDLSPVVLVGKLELPDGTPAVGASVEVRGQSTNARPTGRLRSLQRWSRPKPATAGEDGRFRIAFVPRDDYRFTVHATLSGYPKENWSGNEFSAGETKDLGTVRFSPPCFVIGHIKDQGGEIHTKGWRVTGRSELEPSPGRMFSTMQAVPDPETGEFRLGPFPPGEVTIRTQSDSRERTDSTSLLVAPDRPTQVALVCFGALQSERVVFEAVPGSSHSFGLRGAWEFLGREAPDSNLVLLGPGGEVLQHARWVEGSGRDWEFTAVPVGEYAVELRDPRFQHRRFENVVPGQEYRVDLTGSAGLDLEVLGPDGAPVEAYGLSVTYLDFLGSPDEFQLRAASSPRPWGSGPQWVAPGRLLIEVELPDGSKRRQTVGQVGPGETKRVIFRFGQMQTLRGRVLGPAGEPVPGATVEFTRGQYAGQTSGSWASIETEKGVQKVPGIDGSVVADGQGRFVLPEQEPEAWTLRALASPYAFAIRTVGPGDGGEEVVLRLPATGSVRGRCLLPEGLDHKALSIRPRRENESRSEQFLTSFTGGNPSIAEDGTFEIADLPLGSFELLVREERESSLFSSSTRTLLRVPVEVRPGVQDVAVNLQPELDATCRVDVSSGGKALGGVRVTLVDSEMGYVTHGGAVRISPRGEFDTTDAAGRAQVRRLRSGPAHVLCLASDEGKWITTIALPEPFVAAEERKLAYSLEFVERELKVIDRLGSPLPGRLIQWTSNRMTTNACRARTGAEGTLTLRMPVGEYVLCAGDRLDAKGVPLGWEAGEGPVVVTLP